MHNEHGYFWTPGLKALHDQLIQLVRFGDGIAVVVGESGSGKTELSAQLCSGLGDIDAVGLLSVPESGDIASILAHASETLGLDPKDSTLGDLLSPGEMLAQLRHFQQSLLHDKRLAVIVFDDAHRLDDQALGALMSLLQGEVQPGAGLRLVFFAKPGLEVRIDALELVEIALYDFNMPDFSPTELAEFLVECGAWSDASTSVQSLWNLSKGRPGVALSVIRSEGKQQGASSIAWREWLKGPWPFAHIAAVFGLTLILLWAIWGRDSAPPEAVPAALPPRAVASPSAEPESSLLTTVATAAPTPTQLSQAASPVSVSSPTPASLVTPAPTAVARGEPKAMPPPKPKASVSSVSAGLTEDERFLMAQPGDRFALQVVAASREASLKRFVANQPNRDSLKIYRGEREGKRWFVVVQGAYSDRQSALAAIKTLPADQAKGGPWPRKFSAIQAEIEKFRR